MTELKAGVDLDFQIAQVVGLEPLGIYTGWAPDGCFGWDEQGDWQRVVVLQSKFWPEWTCERIHESFEVDKLFYPDTYDRFHRDFFAKFAHYTSCCAPTPEFSIDLNAAIEAAQRIGLFVDIPADLNYYPSLGFNVRSGWFKERLSTYQQTPALAICAAILKFTKEGKK